LLTIKPLFLPPPISADETVTLSRAGVRMQGARGLQGLVETVQRLAPPERSILCLSYHPMFYFLCERRNPTHWNYLWPGDQTLEDHQALIRQAQKDPPAAVLLVDEAELQRSAPVIFKYIKTEFRLVAKADIVTLYVPR
jgi:hypothetical protein